MSTYPIALVTGASRGIGRAIAVQLAARGVRVAVHYHQNGAAADNTLALLDGAGHETFKADLADPAAAQTLIAALIDRMGGLDILVNNAGVFYDHPLLDVDYETWQNSWQAILNLNLLGPANLSYWAARHMAAHGGGRVVNVSSRGAFRGEPAAPAYGASKAGLNAMSQSLAKALAPHGVYFYVVAPGFVATDMAADHLASPAGDAIRAQSPFNRVATADEVARATVMLALDAPEFMTAAIVDVNGASYLRT